MSGSGLRGMYYLSSRMQVLTPRPRYLASKTTQLLTSFSLHKVPICIRCIVHVSFDCYDYRATFHEYLQLAWMEVSR